MFEKGIYELITLAIALITLFIVIKKFVWDAKKQKDTERDKQKNRDEEILSWITNAIFQQNQHCKLLQKNDITGLKTNDENMKQKQTVQDNEINQIKKELRTLSETIVKLTTEITNLKEAINNMRGK